MTDQKNDLQFAPPPADDGAQTSGRALRDCLSAAFDLAPYLKRLARQRSETFDALETADDARALIDDVLKSVEALDPATPRDEAMRALRQAKQDVHLALAALDLGTHEDWSFVSRRFSEFADLALAAALRGAVETARSKGRLSEDETANPGYVDGLFILALGKLGACELNYSSDIDIIAFQDPDRFPGDGQAAVKIIQDMSQRLESQTEDGYVLRVDHRLRPDPSSTPVAVNTRSAELYYESTAQNWERMAFIKARFAAGHEDAANAFIEDIRPFVWRRHLDYWAVADIHAIKLQIHAQNQHSDLSDPVFDVKLGRGGIREIEFFAQTQQLIHGGRNPSLRAPRTVDALAALVAEEMVTDEEAATLTAAYGWWRGVEHRIQMMNDEHTHSLPAKADQRLRVAKLSGFADVEAFDQRNGHVRDQVQSIYFDLFEPDRREEARAGNLVFTGVDMDPGTLDTLRTAGFCEPEKVVETFRSWHRGGIRATKSARGRQLLTEIEPLLIEAMSQSGDPDAALTGLKTFLAGLSAGVQTLSFLQANPELLKDSLNALAIAPRLAGDLSARPTMLEAMIESDFNASIDQDACGFLEAIEAVGTQTDMDLETAMNAVRVQYRDEHFRIRFQLVRGVATVSQAETAFTRLADICIAALEPHAVTAARKNNEDVPGCWAVCGLGKLGTGEMTSTSDLDMLVVYDPLDTENGTAFYSRAAQRLIAALSAETPEGRLYEADMQLRPSGRAGPVAVRKFGLRQILRRRCLDVGAHGVDAASLHCRKRDTPRGDHEAARGSPQLATRQKRHYP